MRMANDEQDQSLRYINKLKSKAKPHNLSQKKQKNMYYILQWHLLKEEKWYIKHLKVEYF